MGKTVEETKQEMIAVKENETALVDLNSTSKVAIWNLLLYIVAVCFQDLRKYFDSHRSDIIHRLNNQKSGTLAWYRTKALVFQYGFNLKKDSDLFENGTTTVEEIEASKIIKYAAVNDGGIAGNVVIKIAQEQGEELQPISSEAQIAINNYFGKIKFAGDHITIINYTGDKLFLNMRIQVNPLVIDTKGVSVLDGGKPIEKALKDFLKELPFNGELVLNSLIDKLQNVEGVVNPHLIEAKTSWLDPNAGAYVTTEVINISKVPESGYFQIEDFKNITYVV